MPRLHQPVSATAAATSDDAHYLALQARDVRFDGHFFTGVTSTGVYCRPVCKVRTPRRENCRFFALAAQAENAGFRPCLRCRPELAPHASAGWSDPAWSTQDASAILARQAARLLDTPDAWPEDPPGVEALAARLGVSARHLRRIFQAQWGVAPLQYLQTRRLLTAKQLLTDTALPVNHIAALAGFSSVRRFNDAFVSHYRLQPTALRREGAPAQGLVLRCSYRPPLDVNALLGFFHTRAVPGVEFVDLATRSMRRSLQIRIGKTIHAGWLLAQFPVDAPVVTLQVSDSLTPALPTVLARVRHWLDLDADPQAIDAHLGASFAGTAGMRVPGTLDGFELAVRAVLGQQVTVAAARTFAQRLVQQFGPAVASPWEDVTRAFPDATTLTEATPAALGALGIVKQRQGAILALARAVQDGVLALHPGADFSATITQLQALPGIGAWTAQYIAMRALGWPDAFPGGDVALQSALGVRGARQPAIAATALSEAWRPWRSYAVLRLWAGKLISPHPTS